MNPKPRRVIKINTESNVIDRTQFKPPPSPPAPPLRMTIDGDNLDFTRHDSTVHSDRILEFLE